VTHPCWVTQWVLIAPERMLPLYAHLAAFAYASVYVGSLYISKNTRLSFTSNSSNDGIDSRTQGQANGRLRDDPDVIKARLLAVSIASALCCYAFAAHVAPDVRLSRLR
jgi:prenyl protein peptidase